MTRAKPDYAEAIESLLGQLRVFLGERRFVPMRPRQVPGRNPRLRSLIAAIRILRKAQEGET